MVDLRNGERALEYDGWTERFWIPEAGLAVDDLNRDGATDAAFIVACNLGGNTNFESLVIWLAGDDPQVVELTEATSGIRAGNGFLSSVVSVEASGNLVRVRWVGNQQTDPLRQPSVEMESIYRVSRFGEFRFIRNEAQNEASELYEDLTL